MDTSYDILIVGAGLAGLHSALRLSKIFPKKSIAIAEAYNYIGGRVVTYKPKDKEFKGIQWENGAGRIHNSHKMILKYVEEYDLTTIPLSEDSQWIDQTSKQASEDRWPRYAYMIRKIFSLCKPSTLATHTLYQLLSKIYNPSIANDILSYYPYRAEVFHMRADIALQSLQEEMGSNKGFCIVKEGLSTLIQHMVNTLKSKERNITFLMNHRCVSVDKNSALFTVKGQEKDEIPHIQSQKRIEAKEIILALHSEALKHIPPFTRLPILQKITMEPLLRIYAIFPTTKGKSWFSDIPKTITDSPLRYIIPINPAKGVIMISYTDSDDTKPWTSILKKESEELGLQKAILKEARRLFPTKEIPEPLFFKAHLWSEGCSYWKPGLYDPKQTSLQIMNPFPNRFQNVYVCGESYSMKQCWMEGALEHAEEMLNTYFF
jgi:hypothetical protein